MERMEIHTEQSSPIQSSMKAKANLYVQPHDTSTDDKLALFNDIQIMSQIGQKHNFKTNKSKTDDDNSLTNP